MMKVKRDSCILEVFPRLVPLIAEMRPSSDDGRSGLYVTDDGITSNGLFDQLIYPTHLHVVKEDEDHQQYATKDHKSLQ